METVAPKPSALTPEQIARAWDYVELVRQEQGSEQDRAKLARFHVGGPEPARLIGEFGALLSDGCESAASTSCAGGSC